MEKSDGIGTGNESFCGGSQSSAGSYRGNYELLRKNAAVLQQSTIETAKASEKSIVDVETLAETNQMLISTLDEVLKIQTAGKEKRKLADIEINRIENDLKSRLLEMCG